MGSVRPFPTSSCLIVPFILPSVVPSHLPSDLSWWSCGPLRGSWTSALPGWARSPGTCQLHFQGGPRLSTLRPSWAEAEAGLWQ